MQSMVEQAHMREAHDHIVQVASVNHVIIANRTAGLGDVGHAGAVRTLDVVANGKNASLPSATPVC